MFRDRTTVTGGFTTQNLWKHQSRTNCGAWVTSAPDDVSWTGTQSTKFIEDCVTPGYLNIVRAGAPRPLNPLIIDTTTEVRIAGSGSHSTNFTGGCYRAQHFGSAWWLRSWQVHLPPVDVSILNAVGTEAVAKAKEATWDALTDVAQLRQLRNLFSDTWHLVNQDAIRAARYAVRHKYSVGGVLEAFAQKWLEYRYGWRPLMFSLEDACETFVSGLKVGSQVYGRSKMTTTLSDSYSGTWQQDLVGGVWTGTGTESHVLSGERTYRGFGAAVIDNVSMAQYGLDPLSTTWELIPYSFVVDWFVGVGSWLKAVSPFTGSHMHGALVSTKDTYQMLQTFDLSWSGAGTTGSFGTVSTQITVERYVRSLFDASLPIWNPRLTNVRVVDLVALVLGGSGVVRRILRGV